MRGNYQNEKIVHEVSVNSSAIRKTIWTAVAMLSLTGSAFVTAAPTSDARMATSEFLSDYVQGLPVQAQPVDVVPTDFDPQFRSSVHRDLNSAVVNFANSLLSLIHI